DSFTCVSCHDPHDFRSLARAPGIRAPLLTLMASEDTIVPVSHSQRLIAAWGGPHQERLFPGADHNNLVMAAGYHETIRSFLSALDK
ncbi:MAG: hypothetical protein HQM02_06205, partial [Magnetococcales bacterium]|nr:hypothetical protein [Magnetococcales bacterium]